ncbi:MAG: hypothetical protein ACE5IW_05785 [bacterium]
MAEKIKILASIFFLCGFLMVSLNCASQKHYTSLPLITEENDVMSIPKPKPRKVSLYEDAIENIFRREIDEYSNFSWHIRNATNNHKQAKNINALDEVPNSTWFTNRNGKHPMSIEELKRGPNRGTGPAMDGPLTIVAAKVEGVSPGFRVKDRKGDIYFIKFDMKGYPKLNTAAEVITSKFVYAAGYNIPEYYLSTLDPKKLRIAKGVTVKNRWGREVPMTLDYVEQLLSKCHSSRDGTYRIVASKALEGVPIGPFSYGGRRKDDPNDLIPHQHRRELRGYKVIAAWLNNFDTRATNTLDMYVSESGKSFVRHYIIDFGSCLGSAGSGPAVPERGHHGAISLGNMFLKMITLGLWVESWEKEPWLVSLSVGYFESRLFRPGNYAFVTPNPAFQRATELDGFWGAKIVMSFTDEQIRAIVETGEYSNPKDEEYVIKTLIERRDKTGRYWYSKVNPLDNFRINESTNEHYHIRFDDLSVKAGFEEASNTVYRFKLCYRDKELLRRYYVSEGHPLIPLVSKIKSVMEHYLTHRLNQRENVFHFKIQTKRGNQSGWGKYVKIFFNYPITNGKLPQIIAIEREN